MSRKFLPLALACSALLVLALALPALSGTPQRVFANIATDDVNKAAMAIKFTHAAMKQQGVAATVFFNVYGVRLVNKNVPSPVYPTGQSIHQMLEEFMADGGTVLACPMCMKNVGGMQQTDLIAGVKSKPGAGVEAAMAPDTVVLSY